MSMWIRIAGWTLLHFAWQGAALALVAVALLRLLRTASAEARYLAACAALAGMLAAPALTARVLYASPVMRQVPRAARVFVYRQLSPDQDATFLRAFTFPAPGASDDNAWVTVGALPQVVDAFLPVLVVVWLSGVAILLVRLAGGWWRVKTIHRGALTSDASRWQEMGHALARRLRVRRDVRVVDSTAVDAPTMIGWWRPAVLLPVAAMTNLSPSQIEAILAHELAHVRRHDYLVNLLQTIAETLLFYHPAVWWLSARVRTEREHCCDDVAVAVCGDAVVYADALAQLEAWRIDRHGRAAAVATLAVAATGGSLLERVRRVLSARGEDVRTPFMAVPMLVLMALGVAMGAAFLRVPALQATATPALSPEAANPRAIVLERQLVLNGQHVVRLRERELQAADDVLDVLKAPHHELDAHARTPRANQQTMPPSGQRVTAGAGVQLDRLSAATVSGTVTDPLGAVVTGARVVLNDLESVATRAAETDASGRFQFADVVGGDYLLEVSTPWAEAVRERIGVAPRQALERSVRLEMRGVVMMSKLVGPRSARPAQGRGLPNGWSCVDNRPGFCGPPSLLQELERDLQTTREQATRVAFMTRMADVQYPQAAWDARIEGTAVVEGRIGADGVPTGLHVTVPVHADLAAAAIDGVNAARFEPARLKGTNVEVPLSVTVEFRLH